MMENVSKSVGSAARAQALGRERKGGYREELVIEFICKYDRKCCRKGRVCGRGAGSVEGKERSVTRRNSYRN